MPSLAAITSSSFSRDNTSALNVVCLWLVPMRTESVARTNETEGRRAFGGAPAT